MTLHPQLIIKFWQTGRTRRYMAYVRWLGRDWLLIDGEVPKVERRRSFTDEDVRAIGAKPAGLNGRYLDA